MKEISCEVIRDLLPLYEDGAVSEETAELVRVHLKDCAECREELRKMRTPISMPPEEDKELWERFEARRAKQRRKRRIGIACALSLLAAAVAFCCWYSRPRTWTEITGVDADILYASLTRRAPDWDAEPSMEKLKYEHWQVRQDDPRREEVGGKLLRVLNRYTFRASLDSLVPRDGLTMDGWDDITLAVTWEEDGRKLIEFGGFGGTGKMIFSNGWGYDIYFCDPALYDEVTQLLLEYGTLAPPNDLDAP